MTDCPACSGTLAETTFPGKLIGPDGKSVEVTMDQCGDCTGIWFDEAEIEATMGAHTPLFSLATAPATPGERGCVRCVEPMNVVHILGVELDVCPQCAGIWLDPGELKQVFAAYKAQYGAGTGMCCTRCKRAGFAEADLNYGDTGLLCDDCLAGAEKWGAWNLEQERQAGGSKLHKSLQSGAHSKGGSSVRFTINGIDVTGIFGMLQGLFSSK